MRRRVILAAGLLAVLGVGACSHASGDSAGGANSAVSGGDVAAHKAQGGLSAAGASAATAPQAHTAAGGGAKYGSAARLGTNSVPLDDGTYKIRTAQMTVAVKGARNVAVQANAAEGIATGVGGEVDSDNRTSGPDASATLQLRVPPDVLTDTLTALSKLGSEKARQLSTSDVTQKVADVDSRVRSAQDSITRLRVLFAHAQKIADIIAIESELNSREADLESLQAQQRSLARQTSMATITLSLLTAPKHPAPPPAKRHHHHRGGFVGGLERGWDGFSAAAVWVATAVGTLLPFLALLLVVALGIRLLWPRLPRRHPTPAPTE